MKKLTLLTAFLGLYCWANAQFVSIVNKKFVLDGKASCPIYFNGANTPWDKWNDFGSSAYSTSFWSSHFQTLKNNGINSTRIWFTCDGAGQPTINTSGVTTAVSAKFWQDCDHLFQQAKANGIYVMATMMSFDHTKNGNPNTDNWRNMLNNETNVQTFVDKFVVEFVNRYKTNPYLFSIDACNEIEWIYENRTSNNWSGSSYAILQRYVARLAAGVHNNPRADGSTVLVTNGSASTKWNGTKLPDGNNNSDGNKWSDAALKAQYNNAKAVLDYYSPHYYAWMYPYFKSPFDMTPTQCGMDDKACLVGETPCPGPGSPSMSVIDSYNALKNGGWQGHYPWTSNGVDNIGSITNFGSAALAFTNANLNLIRPSCGVVASLEEEPTSNSQFSAFPSPFKDSMTLQANGTFTYSVYDISGKLVEKGTGSETVTIGQHLTTGLYSISLQTEKGSKSLKVVKE